MGRETAVLALAAVLLGIAVHRMVHLTQQRGAPSLGHQGVFGLCCGLLGAVVAAVPYTDVVPDSWERPLLAGLVAALAAAACTGTVRRVRRGRARRAPSSPPLTDRGAAADPGHRAARPSAGTAARSGQVDPHRGAAAP